MNAISREIQIEATPERVFEALSQQEGLSAWWTKDATAEPVVGTVAEFGFYDRAIVVSFRIEELERARRIRWHCIEGPPQYIGSTVVFELTRVRSVTVVHFEHSQLEGDAPFMAHAAQSWERVRASLKAYVETGQGTPISM